MTNNGISYCFNSYARGTGDFFFYNMKIKDNNNDEHYIHEHTIKEIEAAMRKLWHKVEGKKKPKAVKKSLPIPAPMPPPPGM